MPRRLTPYSCKPAWKADPQPLLLLCCYKRCYELCFAVLSSWHHCADPPKLLQGKNQCGDVQTLEYQLMGFGCFPADQCTQSRHRNPSHESDKSHQEFCRSMIGSHSPGIHYKL